VRRVRQLLRKRSLRATERALVVEGAELLSMALESGAPIESVYVAPVGRTTPAVVDVVARVFDTGVRVFDLAPGVIERISDTVTPQPVLAVVGFSPAVLEDIREATMVVVCVDVRDPGNAGTMIRTADAAGVDAVVCCDGTVDPTNPKTVRASAGSIFHTPVVVGGEAGAVLRALRSRGMITVGTDVHGGSDYAGFDWCRRVALVVGNEASGLGSSVQQELDESISIPMVGRAESLNVSVAAAIICFEALRQRRAAGLAAGEPGAGVAVDVAGGVATAATPASAAPNAPGPTMPGMPGAPVRSRQISGRTERGLDGGSLGSGGSEGGGD
jgi:TrmH family RNA methyltransferase